MRIAHLSDIHVQTQRREEFSAVFSSLRDRLLSESPPIDVIAVTGDVYDKKNPTPLNSSDVEALLKMLSAIAPVVMIPGNHDLNMRNRDTADALGELMKERWGASPPSGITYISTSGIHKTHGITWLAAMPDDKNGLPDPDIIPTDDRSPLVVLIHETVVGCSYANGTLAERGGVSRGYLSAIADKCRSRPNPSCAILLGDIHLRQQVHFKGDGERACAWYAGSTICLNLGESHLAHGYLVWDISEGAVTVTGRDVYNPYAPLTVTIDHEGNDTTPEPVPITPSKWRICYNRLCPRKVISDREAEMIDKFSKSTYLGLVPIGRGGDPGISDAVAALTELTVRERHMSVAQRLISTGKWADDVVAAALEEYSTKVLGALTLADAAGSKPHLIELRFDNIFCYGEDNVINFEALSETGVAHGLVAPNRWGKSCIFDIITYAITGRSERFKIDELPRRSSSGRGVAKVQLSFKVGDDIYVVKRTRGSTSTCSWFENGIDMTTGHTRKTSDNIQAILGTYDCLNRLCFMRPQEVTGMPSFHMMDPPKRAIFVSEAMRLTLSSATMKMIRDEFDVKSLSFTVSGLRDRLCSLVGEAWKGKYVCPGGSKQRVPTLEEITLDEASCLEELRVAEKALAGATLLNDEASSRRRDIQEKSYSEEGKRSLLIKTLKDLQEARDNVISEAASLPTVADTETLTTELHEVIRREELSVELKALIDRREILKTRLHEAEEALGAYQQLKKSLKLVGCHESESSSREAIITEEKADRDAMHRDHQEMIIRLLRVKALEMQSGVVTEATDEETLLSTMWKSRLAQRHSLHDSNLFQRVIIDIKVDSVDIREEILPIN